VPRLCPAEPGVVQSVASIGGYELVEHLPHTELVLKGFDEASGCFVALKEQSGPDQEKVQFDAIMLGMLDHPNIARVFNTVSADGLCYLVQEWVDGTDLASIRERAGRLTVAQAITVVRGALRGLAFAHNRQIVHGDVSPLNILVSTAGESKLIDFGAVVPVDVSTPGANRFRSPEVRTGSAATKRSDVFSTAAVLADLLGVRPGRGLFDLSGIDRSIAGVLGVALSENPDVRQAAGAQLLEDLEGAADRSLGLGWPAVDSLAGRVADAMQQPLQVSRTGSAAVTVGPARPGVEHGAKARAHWWRRGRSIA
jgi:serine/threonine protein kinase